MCVCACVRVCMCVCACEYKERQYKPGPVLLSTSNGGVLVITRTGQVVCRLMGKVAAEDVGTTSFHHAVAGMAFIPHQRSEQTDANGR